LTYLMWFCADVAAYTVCLGPITPQSTGMLGIQTVYSNTVRRRCYCSNLLCVDYKEVYTGRRHNVFCWPICWYVHLLL